MALALTKEQREQAKTEQKCMIQISIESKYVPIEVAREVGIPDGGFQMSGPMTPERGRELFAMCLRWLEEGKKAKV
jgi:hypothetical protein